MKRILFIVLGLALIASSAQADVVESADFEDGTSSTLIFTDGAGGAGAISIAGGVATFTGDGDGGRAFLGTAGTDFAAESFEATVDVTVLDTGGTNAFFGLGPGTESAGGGNSFGEPSTGPTVFIILNDSTRDGGQAAFGDFEDPDNGTVPIGGTQPVIGEGSHTLRLSFDADAQEIAFFASINGAAETLIFGGIDTSDNPFDATNSRIFFGGDDGTVFDNFSVSVVAAEAVPEPSSLACLGLGAVGMFVRRRRRA